MARYTGPKHKLARREGINVLDKSSASLLRRLSVPPGVHGRKKTRRLSEYGQQLREKQKLKAVYGLLEKQLVRSVKDIENTAKNKPGANGKKMEAGELLIATLETRFDNIIYRLGLAKTRYQARQLVGHGHALINGKKVNIPSYQIQPGDVISLTPKMQKNTLLASTIEEKETILPFLSKQGPIGKLERMPERADVEVPFDTQLIIEYYSR